VQDSGRSLLAAGVVGVEGRFGPGDTVEVIGPDGVAFARGIVNYSAEEVRRLAGRASRPAKLASWSSGRALPTRPVHPAPRSDGEVIHRDGLVVLGAAR
jgi:glutamate 5-kinase